MVVNFVTKGYDYFIELFFKDLRSEIDPFFSDLLKNDGFNNQEFLFEELTKILEDFFKKGMNGEKENSQTILLDSKSGLCFKVEKSNDSKPFIKISLVIPREKEFIGSVAIYFPEEDFKEIQEETKLQKDILRLTF